MKYKKGEQWFFRDVKDKTLSKASIEELFLTHSNIRNIGDMFYLEPGVTIDKGLHWIRDDKTVKEMLKSFRCDSWIPIYVVREGEPCPLDMWNQYSSNVAASSNGSSLVKLTSEYPIYNRPNISKLTPKRKHAKLIQKRRNIASLTTPFIHPRRSGFKDDVFAVGEAENEDMDGNSSEYEVNGEETTSNESDCCFRESEDDIDDVFGAASYEDGQMQPVEAMEELEANPAEDLCTELEENSDEFQSFSSSDNNGTRKRRFREFNELTDFNKPIHLEVGLKFSSNKVFRKALKQYSILTSSLLMHES